MDAFASVHDVNFQHLLFFVECHHYADLALTTELERVLDQVDQNLFQSDWVPIESLRQLKIGHKCFVVFVQNSAFQDIR